MIKSVPAIPVEGNCKELGGESRGPWLGTADEKLGVGKSILPLDYP